jgi:hypothetical protein
MIESDEKSMTGYLFIRFCPLELEGEFEEAAPTNFEFDPNWRLKGRPRQQTDMLSMANIAKCLKTERFGDV